MKRWYRILLVLFYVFYCIFIGLTYANNQLNTTPISLMNIATARSKLAGNKIPAPIKQELELKLEIGTDAKPLQPYAKSFATMSAPPSPMLPSKNTNTNLLQELLNSKNKVAYTPDYSHGQIQPHLTGADPLANEITQLISNAQQTNPDISYRSQSVPLHLVDPLNQNVYFSQFNFNLTETNPQVNEFTELETLTENEGINVNKIINALEDTTNENALQTTNETDPLGDSIEIEPNVFVSFAATNFAHHHFSKTRSQSVDVDLSSTSLKFNTPSRSVPSTPLPLPKNHLLSDKIVGQSSRSYPSTPLLSSETFTYNQEYLHSTQQVVKEESVNNLEMQTPLETTLEMLSNPEDVLYNNMEFYSMNSDVLEGCNKQNFENEHCMIMENEQNFNGS